MIALRWNRFPRCGHTLIVRGWLDSCLERGLRATTVSSYAEVLEGYLAYCFETAVDPATANAEQVGGYERRFMGQVAPLVGLSPVTHDRMAALSPRTRRFRLRVLRLFYDFVVEHGDLSANPVEFAPSEVPRRNRGRRRDLSALASPDPSLPDDDEWASVLAALHAEPLRERLMVLLAYEGALSREELVSLTLGDLDRRARNLLLVHDAGRGQARVRTVLFSDYTGRLLDGYLEGRNDPNRADLPLFVARIGPATAPLTRRTWSAIVRRLAKRARVPKLTTQALRYLRLVHMLHAGIAPREVALYAGYADWHDVEALCKAAEQTSIGGSAPSLQDIDSWVAAQLA